MSETIALIGLGLLGSALAENLLRAGFTVRGRGLLPAMDVKGERMLEGNFEAEGKLVQHLKDVELMLEVGHAAGTPLMATALHRQLLLAGVAAGLGERDNSSIIAVLRSLTGRPGDHRRP